MKVTQGTTNDFFALTNTMFSILIHQRNDTWEEENCEKLLQDIVNTSKNKKMYFMGSITTLSIK
ncbi:DUF262 domain-containing protein [Helicobacter pylori]|uniref:DUF262 domain-containing protein n=1 Tax=Helicobacter pylori TaxID=210 RepID=UPI000EADE12E|nr:DUF262 domain-containing protein [Helicobacter pylori]MCQ2777644.1 DUF262 domain-containing protein [Helicobacter pylori]MCQ2778561.1 DUF262 domain-containing protein [Helicobacter pylori]TPH77082.1 DUF262 domain-containing protein [Helicobacter pylori]WRA47124.1 DUF262 domain-containing protein [Helicobacter pylori]